METATEVLARRMGSRLNLPQKPTMSMEERIRLAKNKATRYNESEGHLSGYSCEVCKNKGNIAKVLYDDRMGMIREAFAECKCMRIRKAVWRMERSGLENAIKSQRFDTFNVTEPWQESMKGIAEDYAKNPDGWLFFGGQVGSGKTHLCTAVCRELLRAGKEVIYMPWQSEIIKIKANVMDSEEYARIINEYKNAEVLYVDDFFKPVAGQDVTPADLKIAYELINSRYIAKMPTMISSERSVSEIIYLDEAIGSRIYEMSKAHTMSIKRVDGRNYRLKGVEEV